jgi:hypothetical protein
VTEAKLEQRLRFAYECCTIVWKKPKKDAFASVTADSGKKVICLPPGFDDDYLLRTLVHELAHVAIPGELGAFGTFEEDILLRVIEPRLMNYLTQTPRRHAWWMKKLREAKENV